jgi:hypothetical protein
MSAKYILVLPTYGSPYIWNNTSYNDKKNNSLMKEIQEVVQGHFEIFRQNKTSQFMMIHPMFNNERWTIASKALNNPNAKIYLNEDGNNMCCPNMACLMVHKDMGGMSVFTNEAYDKLPLTIRKAPFFGEIAIVINTKDLEKLCGGNISKLAPEEEDEDEDEDDEEEEDDE